MPEVEIGTPGVDVPEGKQRTEPRTLTCRNCGWSEDFETVFVKPKGGGDEVEVTPKDVRDIRGYHNRRTGHQLYRITFTDDERAGKADAAG